VGWTNKRFRAPGIARDWQTDRQNIVKAISDYLLSLEAPGSIAITEATIESSTIESSTLESATINNSQIANSSFDGGSIGSGTPMAIHGTTVKASAGGSFFSKMDAAVAANASITIVNAVRGEALVTNASNSETSSATFDAGVGVVTVGEESVAGQLVAADPGAGANKLWAHFSGVDLVITNRWGVAKSIFVSVITNNVTTPS
jgi:hypothetical protein